MPCSTGWRPAWKHRRPGSSTGSARERTTATSTPAAPCASRPSSVTRPAPGASTRNGGIVHSGYKWSARELIAKYGADTGRALYQETLDSYQLELGKVGTPSTVVEDLTAALTQGIDELTRPVDAIKHQAKTVTVGISRSDETLLEVPLVREVLTAGVARDSLSYRALRTLVDLDPAVEQVTGFTRYRIEGDIDGDAATIHVVDRGGVAAGLPSRTDTDPRLIGTKHRVAYEREVTVAKGRRDGRTLIIVPELKGNQATGLSLLHVAFRPRLASNVVDLGRGRSAVYAAPPSV